MRRIEDQAFLWLLVLTSLAFGMIIWPFFGAVLWGVVVAIIFAPVQRRLCLLFGRRNGLAAVATLILVIMLVIIPIFVIASSLVVEATGLYQRIQSGGLDPAAFLTKLLDSLPDWARDLMGEFDLTNLEEIRGRLSETLSQVLQLVASRAVTVGQSTLDFVVSLGVMLYLLYFLLRDGTGIARRVKEAIPLDPGQRDGLLQKFTLVIRAIVKGTILVALIQGALGGLIFWVLGINAPVLWGVLMALLALLPAIGTGIVWAPVAVYLLVSGAVWKGVILTAFGVLVIGLVDNLLRPILVGRSTKIPDYLVLISTLGGLAIFGLSGFVIGPMIAAMFIAVWDIYIQSRDDLNRAALPPREPRDP